MTRLRNALLAALVWCGVVAVVATLVWAVISRAGQGVVPLTQPQADVTGSVPVPGSDDSPVLRTRPGTTLSPRPSRSTAAPSSGTTTPVTPSTPTSASSAPVAPTPQRRSWSGTSGHVVTECRGTSAELVAAFPNAGWRYMIGSRGPTLVQVRFARGGEDWSVTVDARCVSGVPQFSAPRGGGGDD